MSFMNLIPPHARWITPESLEGCHPSIREFHAYWESKRHGRRMPARADIDPSEIVSFLPNIILLDVASVEPLTLVYRLVGTREVTARGNDPTGRSVTEAFYGRSLGEVLGNYRATIEGRTPVLDLDDKTSPHTRLSECGSLFLPLSDDGETVNKVLVYTAYKPF